MIAGLPDRDKLPNLQNFVVPELFPNGIPEGFADDAESLFGVWRTKEDVMRLGVNANWNVEIAPLRGMQVGEARRVLLRTAAQSMLQDNPQAAPYGWTHCLTMPQAVLVAADHGADPDIAVAVAATYVLGFRATQGRVRLDPAWTPARDSAAGRLWRATDDELPGLVDGLISYGAIHPDAHVAKYTLACLDATVSDPDARRLFLAAAVHLHERWERVACPDDPILSQWVGTRS